VVNHDGEVRTFGTLSQGGVPNFGNDNQACRFHNPGMAKRRSEARPGWYAAEWLEYLHMQQTDLIEATGRSKGRISELVSGRQRFNEDDLAAFSRALGVTRGYLLDVNPLLVRNKALLDRGTLPPPPVPSRPVGTKKPQDRA